MFISLYEIKRISKQGRSLFLLISFVSSDSPTLFDSVAKPSHASLDQTKRLSLLSELDERESGPYQRNGVFVSWNMTDPFLLLNEIK